MEKVDRCPKCKAANPALTLTLLEPEKYVDADSMPDTRTYAVICLNCGEVIEEITIDNTIKAVKELRDEMDRLYGKSEIFPSHLF